MHKIESYAGNTEVIHTRSSKIIEINVEPKPSPKQANRKLVCVISLYNNFPLFVYNIRIGIIGKISSKKKIFFAL